MTGTFTPELPLVQKRLIQLRCIAPGRDRWRRRAGLSPATFKALTKLTERELRAREGAFDVILQLYCVFAAGRVDIGRRYALYLDATAALTRRDFPEGAPIGRRPHRRWFAMEQAAYHRAGRLFPTSEWVRQSLIEDYRVDPARLVVAGAGSNVVAEPIIDRRWDQRVALFVGLDWKRKGGPVLLRAWRQVRDVLPDAELWIAGTRSAYGKDGEGGVRWFGRVDQGRLAALYREASVFVLPSLFDPFPHVLREAMSHGLPCISTPTGGTAEIIKDGHDGILVPAGDADTLARELVALLGKPRRAESMGRAGHARMNEDVTWQSVADLMVPHLEAIARE
ncbi:MAG: glycosyltransferase family 4 protein [Solirubrobacterales bacterium]|nr:glycosyltransferase family 4 protein [Solirubrobacterales bacterium]